MYDIYIYIYIHIYIYSLRWEGSIILSFNPPEICSRRARNVCHDVVCRLGNCCTYFSIVVAVNVVHIACIY